MNKNLLYLIFGIVFVLFVSVFFLEIDEGGKKNASVSKDPYSHLIDDESPLFLQERDIFRVGLSGAGITDISYTEILGVGVNSPIRDKYRFSLKLEDTVPGSGKLINPVLPKIKMKTIYNGEYEIPWKMYEDGGRRKILFMLDDVPAVDASDVGKCCVAATGVPCDNSCGKACSIEFSHQVDYSVNPDEFARVRFLVAPETLKVGKKEHVSLRVSVENKRLATFKLGYYVPFEIGGARLKVINYPRNLNFEAKGTYSLMEGDFEPKKHNSFFLDFEIEPSQRGKIELPVLFLVYGDMKRLVSEPVKAITSREVVKNMALTKFLWSGNVVLRAE